MMPLKRFAYSGLAAMASLVLCCATHAAVTQSGHGTNGAAHKKPAYTIVDGEIIEKDGKRHINIYVRYNNGTASVHHAPVMPVQQGRAHVLDKSDYRWGLRLFREGKKQQAAKVFEQCVLAEIFCLDSLRDYLALINYEYAKREQYLNTIVLQVASKKIARKEYAMLLGVLNPYYLRNTSGALGLIARARKLHGDPEELRTIEEAIFNNR